MVAELGDRGVECALDVVFDGDVRDDAEHAELRGGLVQAALVDVGDRDARAFLDAPLRGGESDAGSGRRGDEHGLALEEPAAGRVGGRGRHERCVGHRGSFGSPNACSPMTFFWISFEPP